MDEFQYVFGSETLLSQSHLTARLRGVRDQISQRIPVSIIGLDCSFQRQRSLSSYRLVGLRDDLVSPFNIQGYVSIAMT